MKRVLKYIGIGLAVLLIPAIGAAISVNVAVANHFDRVYDIKVQAAPIPGTPEAVATGAYLYVTRGCAECHGPDGGGHTFVDAPDAGLRLSGANLTRGKGGVTANYKDEDWFRTIRHGVKPGGKPLIFMPAHEFHDYSDDDIANVVAFIKTLPPVDREKPEDQYGLLIKALYLAGEIPLIPAELVDHDRPIQPAPAIGPTAEYGKYLATGCMGCHGHHYSGGPIPGAPPDWPPAKNITFDKSTGIGSWSFQDFEQALRTGKRPDGSGINPIMPWKVYGGFNDNDMRAVYEFLRSLPPLSAGNQ